MINIFKSNFVYRTIIIHFIHGFGCMWVVCFFIYIIIPALLFSVVLFRIFTMSSSSSMECSLQNLSFSVWEEKPAAIIMPLFLKNVNRNNYWDNLLSIRI